MNDEELMSQGWSQLAGPFGKDELGMMPAFIADAHAAGRETLVREVGYCTGGYREKALMIWQRSKRMAAAA
jgi:hypothetical protein